PPNNPTTDAAPRPIAPGRPARAISLHANLPALVRIQAAAAATLPSRAFLSRRPFQATPVTTIDALPAASSPSGRPPVRCNAARRRARTLRAMVARLSKENSPRVRKAIQQPPRRARRLRGRSDRAALADHRAYPPPR